MMAHLEYAIGVLCLGGVAAVSIHTIIETIGSNWRKILSALNGTDLQEPVAGASGVERRIVSYAGQGRGDEQQHAPANHDVDVHRSSPTPLASPGPGLALIGAASDLEASRKRGRLDLVAGCVISASQVQL